MDPGANRNPRSTFFEWDPGKSEQCKRERGFDFAYAAQIFDEQLLLEIASDRCGEERYMTIGAIDGRVFVVVWTPREKSRRIISARIAGRKERVLYRAFFP
jgi:uncharacterized DUF497 family protein